MENVSVTNELNKVGLDEEKVLARHTSCTDDRAFAVAAVSVGNVETIPGGNANQNIIGEVGGMDLTDFVSRGAAGRSFLAGPASTIAFKSDSR